MPTTEGTGIEIRVSELVKVIPVEFGKLWNSMWLQMLSTNMRSMGDWHFYTAQ